MKLLSIATVLVGLISLVQHGAFSQPTAVTTQAPPPPNIIAFGFYFVNVNKQELANKTSLLYNTTRAQISQALASTGGTLDDVVFTIGGGCTKVYVTLRNGDQMKVIATFDQFKSKGLMVNNQTWRVSFKECTRDSLVYFKFYVAGLTWDTKYSTDNNTVTSAITNAFSDLGGSFRTIKLFDNTGCVGVNIELEMIDTTSVFSMTSKLLETGLTVANKSYNVTMTPCSNITANTDQCPVLSSGGSGTSCTNDTICEAGQKCCSNGSGQTCQPVGYKVKIAGVLLVNMTANESLMMQTNLTQSIKSQVFMALGNQTVKYVELKSISTYKYINMINTLLNINLYLVDDLTKESLRMLEKKLVNIVLQWNSLNGIVTVAKLGIDNIHNDPVVCGSEQKCYGICKTYIDGQTTCSCSVGYYGSDCNTFDCRTVFSIFANTTVHHCKNNGTCAEAADAHGYQCTCPPGYYGDTCEARLCDYLRNPCSGQGSCIGSISDGRLCDCNSGRGGLACEKETKDNLTSCELRQRLTTAVNTNIQTSMPSLLNFTLDIKDVFKAVGVKNYKVQNCSQNKESSIECLYDIANGQPQQCNCSFQNGTSGFFYGPADCRAFAPATHTNIVLYILTDWPDDIEKRMEIYNRLSEFFFTLESLYVGPVAYNGRPGCVAATVTVMLNNPGNLNFTIQKIKNTGILLNNKIVQITNENCDFTADLNLLNFKLPLVNFTWSDSLKNHSSEMYTAVLMAVQSTFSNLTGKPRYLEVVQKSDCAVIDVQWETTNISNFFTLMDKLKTNGLVISNKTYGVNKQQCNVTDDSVIVDFKFFVIQLPWLDSYTDINSDDFKQFRNALITNSSLKDLDGSPETLILMKRDSCVEVYVQWRNASKLFSVMDNLRKTGLDLDGVHYNISMKPCTLEPVMLLTYKKVKLYSNTLKWSDTLKNESSAEYLALQKDFLNQFNVNLDSFKLDVSFGCIELDIDFNINSNDLSKVDNMYSDGITLNGSKFTTQFCSSVVYYSKFMWNITFENQYSDVIMRNRTNIELQLNLEMRQYNIPGYNISRIVGFAPATSDQVRVKRQTSGTVCMIESLFTSEVPVSRLYEVRQELLKKKTLSEMTILNITFGYGGGCPTENCFNMSFCVSTADGLKKCACPDMYFGKTCSDKNTSVICSNETVCKSDEKCYRTITCLGDNCKDKKTVCIAKNKNLACDNQTCASGSCDPCNGRGVCYNRMADRGNDLFSAGRVSYYCECNSGFGGDSCEVNQTICQKFQDVCKPTACLGDLENGQICQCPDLYGGLFCNKLARTPCEKWKAFYEDVQSIQSGNPALNITNEQKSILMSFKVSLNHTVCSMDVCNGVLCQAGEKCVAENATCSTGMCNLGVCKATMKPGVCPRPDISSFNKLLSNGLAACSPGDCFDDSDCDGEEKCCGLCGSKCMKPAATSACADDLAAASDLKELVSRSKMAIRNVKQDSDAYKVLMRLANISSLWIPKCKNKELYEALQCLESTSNQTEPKTCFCVDVWGKKIAGISPNTSDPNSCTVKPFTCPVLEPPSPSVRMFDCTSDLDCFGSNKCCSYGVGKMCTTPVDESQLITVLDKVMNRACTVSANLCLGNATCNGDWKAKGEICVCPQGRIGPFCENTTTGPALTSCQKKALAYTVLRGGRLVSMSNMSNVIVLQQVLPSYNNSTEPFTVTDYNCLPNGDYSPTQCVHYLSFPSMSYVNDTECFCVDQNGQEILGTRISATLGQPFCGKNSMCPIGNPLSDDSGNPQTCNSSLKTPEGYVCKRSRYGRMFYCPTAEALDSICNLTLDVGSSNSEACSSTNSTRYYYNATTKTCQTFTFKGCAGNPNNFLTVDNCAAQCIKNPNMRPGSCPSDKVSVARGQCKDQCSSDVDCGLAQKCCKINCARQCVPAVDESNKNLKCPLGQSRGQCSASTPCGKGLYCNNGFCCLNYNGEEDSDFCSVPPVLGENCATPEERYFYNSTSQMCQKFNYSGCQPEFNNFASLDDCCTSCGKKGRCKVGECPAIKIGSISSCGNQCSADGECPGKKICCSTGCGFQCVLPAVSSNTSDCVARQTQVKIKMNLNVTDKDPRGCDVTHIPRCESDGSWSKLQCQPTLGICWCVTSQGNYVENTITKGSPPCNTISVPVLDASDIAKKDVSSANITVCQTGTSPKCCPAALCHKPCAAYPNAQCVIDPCGGCTVQYYDETGLVDCTEKFTTCEKERNDVISYVLENHITSMLAMNMNLDDLEDEMNTTSTSSMTTGIALVTSIPVRCQLQPDPGTCKGYMPQWYYDVASSTCKLFIWGMCDGNMNRFPTADTCYQTCNAQASPCVGHNCTSPNMCTLGFEENCMMGMDCELKPTCKAPMPTSLVYGPYVPQCMMGGYSYKQCFGGYCWCVYENGTYRDGLTNKNVDNLDCSSSTSSSAALENCTNGQPPNVNCVKACNNKVCPDYPNAHCVVDMCSPTCETRFVDAQGSSVTCGVNRCKVFSFNGTEQASCVATSLCPNARPCPESICQEALMKNCSSNPCAVCLTDPCTCMPYFVDARTRKNLTQAQCTYLSQGTCAIKSCNVKKEAVLARLNNLDVTDNVDRIPTCTDAGKFVPKQCLDDTSCHCVNAFGQIVNETVDANTPCKAIEEIKTIRSTFTYRADFKKFKELDKLPLIKNQFWKKTMTFGIDNATIKTVTDPYEGSIKINMTLESNPNSANTDMTIVFIVVSQAVNDFNLIIDNETLVVIVDSSTVQSEAATSDTPEVTDASSGLSERDKIIIGCVVGIGGGLILITIIILCVCCYHRKEKNGKSASYGHIGAAENANYDEPPARMNQAYKYDDDGEDDRYIKVKL